MSDAQFLRTVPILPVHDIALCTRWYEHALGFRTIYLHEGDSPDEATNYAILRRENVDVHLILDEPSPHARAWTKAGTGLLYLIVRDIDELFRTVQATGLPITRGLQTESWGARSFNLTDPSGNAIQIEQAR